jgi:hypothetical protein
MTLPSSLYYLTHPFTKERVYAPKTFKEKAAEGTPSVLQRGKQRTCGICLKACK